jgi:hypothetical protein
MAMDAERMMIAQVIFIVSVRIQRMFVEFRRESYAFRTWIVRWARFVMPFGTTAVPMVSARNANRRVRLIVAVWIFDAMRVGLVSLFRVMKVLLVQLGKHAM